MSHHNVEAVGAVPLNAPPAIRNVAVENPTIYFANALRYALVTAGIDVRGPTIDIDELSPSLSRENGTVLISHRSPPLPMLATTMMKLSQNLYAETLLRTIGSRTSGRGSAESGRAAVQRVLEEWRISGSELLFADGSGLSRYNLITPDALVRVLAHVYADDRLRSPFMETLPIAGRDGTLATRMKSTPAEGNVRAKTGSFSNARALAGYVTSADGEPLAFAVMANNFGISPAAIDRTMDAILIALAKFSRR